LAPSVLLQQDYLDGGADKDFSAITLSNHNELTPSSGGSVHKLVTEARTKNMFNLQAVCGTAVQKGREAVQEREEYFAQKPKVFRTVYNLVSHRFFSWAITLFVLANTFVLCLDRYHLSDTETVLLSQAGVSIANQVFTFVFIMEMVLKLVAFGPWKYSKDLYNLVDATIVVVGVAELISLYEYEAKLVGGESVKALRALRMLRIVKLARSFSSLQTVLKTLTKSVKSVGYMFTLVGLFIFVSGVAGVQLFKGDFEVLPEDERPRLNFDSLSWSMLAIFTALTNEDWPDFMGLHYKAQGANVVFFHVFVSVFGIYVVMSLFQSIILQNFEVQEDGGAVDKDDLVAKAKEHYIASWRRNTEVDDAEYVEELVRICVEAQAKKLKDKEERIKDKSAVTYKEPECSGLAFGCIPASNPIRLWCFRISTDWRFEMAVLVLIIANCIMIAFDSPSFVKYLQSLSDDGTTSFRYHLETAEVVFTVLFVLEMVMKCIGLGLLKGPSTYLAVDNWNKLDMAVVLMSLVSLAVEMRLQFFQGCRAMRVLRLIVRMDGVKVVVQSFYQAIPSVFNVFVFCGILITVFGIVGLTFFKGLLWQCSDMSFKTRVQCAPQSFPGFNSSDQNATDTQWQNFNSSATDIQWQNYFFNFDNIIDSVFTLFQVATLSGWPSILFRVTDTSAVDMGLKRNDLSWSITLFFVVYIMIASFFALNLFVGVVISTFNILQREYDGSALMTEEQKAWISTQRLLSSIAPRGAFRKPKNKSKFRLWCYHVITARWSSIQHAVCCSSSGRNSSTAATAVGTEPSRSSSSSSSSVVLGSAPEPEAEGGHPLPPPHSAEELGLPGSAAEANPKELECEQETAVQHESGEEDIPEDWDTQSFFDVFIMVCILLNTCAMAAEHHGQSQAWTDGLFAVNVMCVTVFTAEAGLRVVAMGVKAYWRDPWNRFDLVSLVLSYPPLFADLTFGGFSTIRSFKVIRLLRLIKKAKRLRVMFDTLVWSLPSLWNIGVLILFVLYLFAILGVALFGSVKQTTGGLTEELNFEGFGSALFTLFQMCTGDDWETINKGVNIQEPDCSNALGNCGPPYASLFFVFFIVLGSMILIELYTAAILESFGDKSHQESVMFESISKWRRSWDFYDPKGKGYISAEAFCKLMVATRPPFGVGREHSELILFRVFRLCNLQFEWLPDPYPSKVQTKAANSSSSSSNKRILGSVLGGQRGSAAVQYRWCAVFHSCIFRIVNVVGGLKDAMETNEVGKAYLARSGMVIDSSPAARLLQAGKDEESDGGSEEPEERQPQPRRNTDNSTLFWRTMSALTCSQGSPCNRQSKDKGEGLSPAASNLTHHETALLNL